MIIIRGYPVGKDLMPDDPRGHQDKSLAYRLSAGRGFNQGLRNIRFLGSQDYPEAESIPTPVTDGDFGPDKPDVGVSMEGSYTFKV